MSHFKERAEKICLNCNAELYGRFCHVCGQENREPKETVWSLVSHFFSDVTHFDGKFFSTTKYLIARPGFLPKEYIKGRRASWINPIRMYIFSSAIFFIIFFSMFEPKNMVNGGQPIAKGLDSAKVNLAAAKKEALKNADTKEDSLAIEKAFGFIPVKIEKPVIPKTDTARKDTTKKSAVVKTRRKNRNRVFFNDDNEFASRQEYDSAQAKLPKDKRDGWWKRRMTYRSIDLEKRFEENPDELWKDVLEKLFHTFPYLLFVSLPLYALYLKLIYIRRKRFYYVDHGIFLIYLYVFTFLFLLVVFGLNELPDRGIWEIGDWLLILLFLYGIYYTFRAMRKFYEQGWWKTFFKFVILNILAITSLVLLFILFFLLTIFRV